MLLRFARITRIQRFYINGNSLTSSLADLFCTCQFSIFFTFDIFNQFSVPWIKPRTLSYHSTALCIHWLHLFPPRLNLTRISFHLLCVFPHFFDAALLLKTIINRFESRHFIFELDILNSMPWIDSWEKKFSRLSNWPWTMCLTVIQSVNLVNCQSHGKGHKNSI